MSETQTFPLLAFRILNPLPCDYHGLSLKTLAGLITIFLFRKPEESQKSMPLWQHQNKGQEVANKRKQAATLATANQQQSQQQQKPANTSKQS